MEEEEIKCLKQTSVSGLLIEFINNSAFPLLAGFFFFYLIFRKKVFVVLLVIFGIFLIYFFLGYKSIYNDFLFLLKNSRHFKQRVSLAHVDNVFLEHSMAKEVLVCLYSEVIIILVCTFLDLY